MNAALRPMFPHAVDSTMLSAFRSCPQKMFRSYVEHWKPKDESVHLVAGAAFAKGIEAARKAFFEGLYEDVTVEEVWNEGLNKLETKVHSTFRRDVPGNRSAAEACGLAALIARYGNFECPADSAKSLERTAGALEFYFEKYELGNDGMVPLEFADGRRAIEFSFANPLDVRHPVTGDPILYTGRADMVARFQEGIYVVDEKTTSQLGASWPRQWEMRGQFSGYIWAANQSGIKAGGAIVRGVSILKTKYDTLQVPTYRSPYELDRWYEQTLRDVNRMIQCWEAGWWDYAMDGACAEYGGCSMMSICKSSDPETWLPMRFDKRVWDPLGRKEMTVEEFEKSWGHERAA